MRHSFRFIIDTEKYAGNFERQLTAYISGCIGDCGVGEKEKKEFELKYGCEVFSNIVAQEFDDNGCYRPCGIIPTPGWYNDGHGCYYKEGAILTEDCPVKTAKGESVKFPAHLSVAIYFYERPEEERLSILKSRTKEYCELKNIPLIGFRMVKVKLVEEEVVV